MWWHFLAAFFFGRAFEESPAYRRVTRVILIVFLLGLLIVSVVWATIVFSKVNKQAIKERSKPSHVHTQPSH